jgi:beta-fructofuranosidase
MLRVLGHHLGDSWYYVVGNRAHCFFLICPDTTARHTAWDIAHASSLDLTNWVYHGIVLRRGPAAAWDGTCLATGSVLNRGARFWMAYTGNWFGPRPAVGLAVSHNLCDWEKAAGNPITTIDEQYYTATSRGRRMFPHWRDPFLFEIDGVVYQLACATAKGPDSSAGTVGVARSRDMTTWEVLPPLDVDPFAEELECPQVVAGLGRYYLVFSTLSDLLLSNTSGAANQPGGNMYAMLGDTPLGPFRVASLEPVLPADMTDRPYAGRIVDLGGKPYLLGTVWNDAGDRISDPIPIELTATGVRARV